MTLDSGGSVTPSTDDSKSNDGQCIKHENTQGVAAVMSGDRRELERFWSRIVFVKTQTQQESN